MATIQIDSSIPTAHTNPRPMRILEAASRCFSERGFQSTTIGDIAGAAGVSRPVVYKYFGDKDGLIDSVLRTTFKDWEDLNEALISPPPPSHHRHGGESVNAAAVDALTKKFEDAIEFTRERPIFRAILQQDPQIVLRGHLEGLRRCRAVSADATRAILRAGIARCEFRRDIDEEATTASLEMILFGLLERSLGLRPGLVLDSSLLDTTLDLLIAGLRSTGAKS
jgi:AcrR family transcriptional regulator